MEKSLVKWAPGDKPLSEPVMVCLLTRPQWVKYAHNSDSVTFPMLASKPFLQAQIKENIQVSRHWPLWGESTGDQ